MASTGPQLPAGKDTILGVLATFAGPPSLIAAAEQLRECGYTKLDAFTPFPLHELDHALGVRPTRLPWLVLACGVAGGIVALAFQWWTNAVGYPFLISGKPLFSLPANIPVTFEVIILASAFAACLGMLAANGLPRLSNPLFRSEQFRRATTDGFVLWVEARDPKFSNLQTREILADLGATNLEVFQAVPEESRLPRPLLLGMVVLGCLALVPPAMIAKARVSRSDKPRIHNFFNMDVQPKFKAQTRSILFADGRAMRPPVPGTVARGELDRGEGFSTGISEPLAMVAGGNRTSADIGNAEATVEQAGHEDELPPNWLTSFPLPVTGELMERGRERFGIYCAVCHGLTGEGDGLASVRALELQQGTWVPPTSLHVDYVRAQPVGQLFHTITHGIRKMPGYASQISPEDRWAIVLYVRALQRSQNAGIDDVPEELRSTLRETN